MKGQYYSTRGGIFHSNIFKDDGMITLKRWDLIFCIPESLSANISHHIFAYIITFVNSEQEHTISKGDLYSKTVFKRSF